MEAKPLSTPQIELAAAFEDARNHLVRVAYAVLGSRADAEDVVADCWLRLVAADRREPIRDVAAWGTVAVSRASLDLLRSARHRREIYTGEWLPEPTVRPLSSNGADARSSLDDDVRYAILVVLESLTPSERVSFVLHDLFGYSFQEIGDLVGRTPGSARQLARRARKRIDERTPRFDVAEHNQRATFHSFLAACAGGSVGDLLRLLDDHVVVTADGGGIVTAALRPVRGAHKVVRLMVSMFDKLARSETDTATQILVNGEHGLALTTHGRVHTVMSVTTVGARITRIDLIRAPDKLRLANQSLTGQALAGCATPTRPASHHPLFVSPHTSGA